MENARLSFNRKEQLAERGFSSHETHENARAALREAEAGLKAAQDALKLAVAGPRQETIEEARAQLTANEITLDLAKRKLSDAELVAPSNGIILTRVREPGAIVAAGKTVPAIIIALVSATAMLALGWFLLGTPIRGSLLLLYFSMTVYLAANVGIGLFVSSLAATQQQAIIGLFLYMMPAVLLSGYATPVENMPDWLQWLTQTNPITHFIVICKSIFLKDAPASVILWHLWPMALIAVGTLSAGAWFFRRRLA